MPPRRRLTADEFLVFREVQAYWGEQNTVDDVFFTDRDEAALFVRARDGSSPLAVSLTNLGQWYADGTLSVDQLRGWIRRSGDARNEEAD